MNKTTKTDIYKIDPRSIVVAEGFNSRIDFGDIAELAEQIKEQGVLNPITVIPFKTEDGTEKYRLVDGERRFRAVTKLLNDGVDIPRVPALFASKQLSEEDLLVQQIIRNQGKPFNEYEYGVAFKKFVDMGMKNADIAKKLGVARWKVDCFLAHLNRDERVQELLKTDKITGVDVRHIYQAAKDESKAVEEILKLAGIAEKKAKENNTEAKISLKDLAIESDYNVAKDSAAIKKGLSTLFQYIDLYTNNGATDIEMDIYDIYEKLSSGKQNIKQIFEEAKKNYSKAL